MSPSRLILVDGLNVLYRAFFAIRDLSTADGRPTNALLGFIRMVRQMEMIWAPTHLGVVFDGGACVERVAMLAEYKANRAPMPDALRQQLEPVHEYLDLAGIPWRRDAGREADDVIASLAVQASEHLGDVLIGTSDKDMLQLVNERVSIVPVSGSRERMDAAAVREKTGVEPGQIVEWLALTGDTADNIAGVPGVGPKTAAKLIKDFGSVAELGRNLDRVASVKVRESLRDNWGRVERNVELVRLRTDLRGTADWSPCRVSPPDPLRLLPFYERMELRGLADSLRQKELF